MLTMNFSALSEIVHGKVVAFDKDRPITFLLTDSRKPILHDGAIFFAIKGDRNDGHAHIQTLYEAGVNQFLVEENYPWENFPKANAIRVKSSIEALQLLAIHHRQQFTLPVIGITGSNGKTIIKEWLYQLLSYDQHVIKNPGSYNSQLGVPLSVWQIQSHHQLGIFEAGLSKPGEMAVLQKIIQPTWGLFTNLGTAHDENFPKLADKLHEKLKLFNGVKSLIYCTDHQLIHQAVKAAGIPSLSWGRNGADISIARAGGNQQVRWKDIEFTLQFPFTDAASIENANHCIAVMLALGYSPETISQRIQSLHSVPMRLELKEGINQCQVIDDTYNNDLGGLQISLDFLNHQHQKKKRTLILSDILQSGLPDEKLVSRIADLVNNSGVSKLIAIGPVLSQYKGLFQTTSDFYLTTEEFLERFQPDQFNEEIILVKGARVFRFERIAKLLQRKVHGTVMEVNLGALVQNLNHFKSKLNPGVKLMVMVKAFAYGSGSAQVANVLQYHQVGYLGVAYADEGVDLRRHNITLPIMVMNPVADGFQAMLTYSLEPELYNFKILHELISFLNGRILSVHLKLDTGMHRLGFEQNEIDAVIGTLKKHPNIKVASIFSHLVGADEKDHDAFTRFQANQFLQSAKAIKEGLGINPLLHILNTSGVIRFPELQLNMVRLGIGLYGVDPTGTDQSIKPVVTLKSIISQIKYIRKGESVGYGRRGIADKDMKLATIAIGYADGYNRAFSRGVGQVLVKGRRASVIGNVCMDMTMIDITGIEASEGDEVIIFGDKLPIQEVAERINTIPYELLTNTSDRVKRVFFAEGI